MSAGSAACIMCRDWHHLQKSDPPVMSGGGTEAIGSDIDSPLVICWDLDSCRDRDWQIRAAGMLSAIAHLLSHLNFARRTAACVSHAG